DQLDIGVLLAQLLQHRRKHIGERRWSGPKMNAARVSLLVAAHRRERIVGLRHDALGTLDQIAPGGCRTGLLADAIEKLEPNPLLELADLQADRRLSEIELAPGGGEASEPRDGDQGPE